MKKIGTLLLALITASQVFSQTDFSTIFEKTDGFMQKFVHKGLVDYKSIKANESRLKMIRVLYANTDLHNASTSEKKAFWINAYNFFLINQIVKNFPLNSPLDIEGLFTNIKQKVAGELLTLENIEKQKLMAVYKDPRLHFVLVCGALGCPQLADFAYWPKQLDKQIEERTRKTLNSSYFIRVDSDNKNVLLSQIFKWYASDFLDKSSSIVSFINQYRTNPIPSEYSLDYYEYDWSINIKK